VDRPAPLRASPSLGRVVRMYEERLTSRGRYLLWATIAFAVIGVDTRRTQVFELFAIALAILLVAAAYASLRRPKLTVTGQLPRHLTAGRALTLPLRISSESDTIQDDVLVSWARPMTAEPAPEAEPRERFVTVSPGDPTVVSLELTPSRRGRYHMRGVSVQATDPLRAAAGRSVRTPDETVVVYPRYFTVSELEVPLGRRYQPGGIPLTSSTGDAIEFVGIREYRPGDPIRSIHWRSWARRGEPIVKEYQEEYFCRLALILDTFLPRRAAEEERAAFEAGISVLASVADYFSRSEYIVDVLAAGPDVYQVSAGRSLAYLDNILDVLACLDPCYDPPFARIGPHLFERLAQLTTVIAVLQDWDDDRERFLGQVKAQGTSVRGFVVREGEPSKPLPVDGEFGDVTLLRPSDVQRALDSEGAISLLSSGGATGAIHA